MTTERHHLRFPAGARASLPSPIPWARAPCGSRLAVLLAAALLVTPSPAYPASDEHLEAAMSLIQPPSDSELKWILDLTCDRESDGSIPTDRLADIYRSRELRRSIAEVYTRYLSVQDLKYLQKAFDSEVFRKYRRVAPLIFVEVLALEEDAISEQGIGQTGCPVRPASLTDEASHRN